MKLMYIDNINGYKNSMIYSFIFLMLVYFQPTPTPHQKQGPDGKTYTNYCTSYNNSGTDIQIWFNDTDGDCISDDWIALFWKSDGTVEQKDAWSFGDPNSKQELNFNAFSCCDEVVIASQSCDFTVDGSNVYVDCGNEL